MEQITVLTEQSFKHKIKFKKDKKLLYKLMKE